MTSTRRPASDLAERAGRGVRRSVWRLAPDIWVRDKIQIDLARYRSREELAAWLRREDTERHEWAQHHMDRGDLILDPRRSYQAEALRAMAKPGRYAFRWANGVAKTTTAALLVLWFLDCYPGGKVLTTAGTWSQLKEQLWREIALWAQRTKAETIFDAARVDKTQIDVAPDWAAFGRAADKGETFEGVHAEHVLVLMDEAKAIKPEIFESVRRILRGAQSWWVCLSSPGSPSGPFWEICQGDRADSWHTFRLSAYESSRVSLQTIEEDVRDLGEGSPLFVSMDLGEFPAEGDDVLIPLSYAQAAVDRVVSQSGRPVMCVDVARMGDNETVIGKMHGRRFDVLEAYKGKRATHTAGRIRDWHGMHPFEAIVVDEGGVGGPVIDMLLEPPVVDIVEPWNAAARKSSNPRYFDLTTAMLFAIRRDMELGYEDTRGNPNIGLSIPNDKLLLHQLTGRKWKSRSNGQIKAESKDEMRARGEKSPDRADAMVMGYRRTMHHAHQADVSLATETVPTHFGGAMGRPL